MKIAEKIKKLQIPKNDSQVQSTLKRFSKFAAEMQAKGLVKKQTYNFPTLDEQDRLLYSSNQH